jgi:hypothetical protein
MCRVPRALSALDHARGSAAPAHLGSQSLWLDEALTGRLARGSLGDLLHRAAGEQVNLPLFYRR